MSAKKNERQGIPKPFSGLTKAKFPEAKPIFWGKNQDTDVSEAYVEPEKPKEGLLRLPQVIRFITTKTTPIFVTRFFEYGYFDQTHPYPGFAYDPTSYVTTLEIADVYDANQTSQEVTDTWAPLFGTWFFPHRWYFGLTNIISGNIATQYNAISTWIRTNPTDPNSIDWINFFPITGLILQP